MDELKELARLSRNVNSVVEAFGGVQGIVAIGVVFCGLIVAASVKIIVTK